MSMRYLGGFITASYNPFKVPNAPTIGTATAGNTSASVSFTAPTNVGGSAITSYVVVASTGQTATNGASPITVTGLTNGVAVTFQVTAINIYGSSALSVPSNSVTYAPKLFSWGSNNAGQGGLGTIINMSSPTQVGSETTWKNTSSYAGHTLSVKTNGTLWSWGDSSNGELGQNNIINLSSPVQVGALTTWANVINGIVHTLSTKTDGTLWAWGKNQYGQLGLNDTVSRSSPVQVGSGTTWLNISGGNYHSLASKTDGSLWAWGYNVFGALGANDIIARSSPVQVGLLTTWSLISGCWYASNATKTDGTLWSWGANITGQLGQGDVVNRSSPVQVGALTTWSKLQLSGTQFSFATKTDGTLWSWGYNFRGQLGQNDVVARSSPVQVGLGATWSSIAVGESHTLVTSCLCARWG